MKTNYLHAGLRAGRLVLWSLALLMFMGLPTVLADDPVGGNNQIDQNDTRDQALVNADYVPAQLVVGFESGVAASEVLGDGRVVGVVATMAHASTMLLELAPGVDVEAAAADIKATESVRYAHPNYLIDRLHPVQGSYPFPDVIGSGDYATQVASSTLGLAAAHQVATGSGVTVGILDVGIDFANPTLSSTAISGHDFVDDDNNSFDEPGGLHSGHGTFVAGVVHLTAPDAQVKAYRIADQEGYGDGFTLAQAIELAADEGCRVVNLSVVLTNRHLAVRDAIDYATSANALVVAAAGNYGEDQAIYPAAEASAMAVGAVDSGLVHATFSTHGSHLSVCGPGVDVYSTHLDDLFAWWSGTSFSAPFAAGLAALLAEVSPSASAVMIRGAIEITATDLDARNPGLEGLLGEGLIDPPAALAYMGAPTTATVTPDTVYFTHAAGTVYFTAPFVHVLVESSNAPALFFAEVTGPDTAFTWVTDSIGMTDETVMIQIQPFDVPGTYMNTVLFHVDSVAAPARLTVHLEVVDDTLLLPGASVTPSLLFFQAGLGEEGILSGNVVLQSSNAPANYVASVLIGGPQLASVPDSTGITPDSVTIVVDPSLAPAAGVYEDTVAFFVEGVPYPVPVFVIVEITDSLVIPAVMPRISIDTIRTVDGSTIDVSVRAPVGGFDWGGFDFLLSYDDSLLTFESATAGDFLTGCGWEYFSVRPDTVSPDAGLVRLVALADQNNVPGQPLCLEPPPGAELARLTFSVIADSNMLCTIAPIRFWWNDCGDNGIATEDGALFIVADDTLGSVLDYDGLDLTFLPGIGGPPWPCPGPVGPFGAIPGARFQSGAVFINCGTGGPIDTAWVIPDTLRFTFMEGFTPTVLPSAWASLASSNAPAPYYAMSWAPGPMPLFALLLDTVGVTNDSVEILVNPAGMAPATYVNYVLFNVDGVQQTTALTIELTIEADTTIGGDSAWAIPDTGLTLVMDELDTLPSCVFIHSSNAPAQYFVEVAGTPTFVSLLDSVGFTNDSVCFVATVFLPPGTYVDTLLFYVDDVVNSPVVMPITLIVPSPMIMPEIRIDTVSAGDGTDVEVLVRAPLGGLPWGGFDLLLSYDDSLLTFQTGVAGDFLVGCDWEYFTAQSLPPDTGLVRLIALADRTDITGQPTCLQPQPGDILARLTFSVVADSNMTCATAPIRFWWQDCGDNAISSSNGDTLIIAGNTPQSVLDFNSQDLTGQPGVGGPPWPCSSGTNDPIAGARFRNGAVFINCGSFGDSIKPARSVLVGASNYPNPFNPQTEIAFSLASGAEVRLEVFNILGQNVARVVWRGTDKNGRPASSGVYFYRLQAGAEMHLGKMVMVR